MLIFVYKADEIQWRSRKCIYLAEYHAHLLTGKVSENTSLRIINISSDTIVILTKLIHVRFQALTAV